VFLAEGGGGSSTPTPQFTGTQTLHVEPDAIPAALKAFTAAHDRVVTKIGELRSLSIDKWAGDPVSDETAVNFKQRSNAGGADSAIACLEGYEKQLKGAIDSLQKSHDEYVLKEGDNAALWGKYHSD
jgi:hypothetical protein